MWIHPADDVSHRTPEDYLRFRRCLKPGERLELEAKALEIGQAEIDPLNPALWETWAWIFADHARAFAAAEANEIAVVAIGPVGAMFQPAEQLREPVRGN
jgi:hypothetical protein